MGEVYSIADYERDDVGQIATVGDIAFIRYRDPGALLLAGRVTDVYANGRIHRVSVFGGEEHNDIGVGEVIILPQTQKGFRFAEAVNALEKRGARGFRTAKTAQRFLMRFLTA